VALVGLTFGFAVSAFAQEKDSVDPKTAEHLSALSKKTDESYNNGDEAWSNRKWSLTYERLRD
jgi:hypothetical protein